MCVLKAKLSFLMSGLLPLSKILFDSTVAPFISPLEYNIPHILISTIECEIKGKN